MARKITEGNESNAQETSPSTTEERSLTAILQETQGVIDRCRMDSNRDAANELVSAMSISRGIDALRTALDKPLIRDSVMALQGNGLGFRTDQDNKGGYEWPIVREAVIEGLIRGVNPTGNKMNIIAGRFYCTKEGMGYLVDKVGITNLRPDFQVPTVNQGQAIVKAAATWRFEDQDRAWGGDIPVRVNAGMGPDAILGKARRKLLAIIYSLMTDTTLESVPEGEVDDTVVKGAQFSVREEESGSKSDRVAEMLKSRGAEAVAETLKSRGAEAGEEAEESDTPQETPDEKQDKSTSTDSEGGMFR